MDQRPGQKQLDIMNKTADTASHYNNNTKRKIILTENEILDKYPYQTTKLAGLFTPEHFGFTDRFMGGNVYKCAKVQGKPYVLLVNKSDLTIAVMIPDENLKDLTVSELRSLCKKFNKEVAKDAKKDDLIDILLS